MVPYILGALVGKATTNMEASGFSLERAFLAGGGLDTSGASQGDGAGGTISAYFTPDFVARYLAFMAKQKNFSVFRAALPVLGRDGTLYDVQTNSPAAGQVFAKTGTFGGMDKLNERMMLVGKGLAGYTLTSAMPPRMTFSALRSIDRPKRSCSGRPRRQSCALRMI